MRARIDGLTQELDIWKSKARTQEDQHVHEAENMIKELEDTVQRLRAQKTILDARVQSLQAAIASRDDEVEQLSDACEWQLDGVMA